MLRQPGGGFIAEHSLPLPVLRRYELFKSFISFFSHFFHSDGLAICKASTTPDLIVGSVDDFVF